MKLMVEEEKLFEITYTVPEFMELFTKPVNKIHIIEIRGDNKKVKMVFYKKFKRPATHEEIVAWYIMRAFEECDRTGCETCSMHASCPINYSNIVNTENVLHNKTITEVMSVK